jgi:hypothetical protein
MAEARAAAQLGTRSLDAILDRGIDLILDGSIACPTGCHAAS